MPHEYFAEHTEHDASIDPARRGRRGRRGLVAGEFGRAAMDALWFARYRRGGGHSGFQPWKFSSGFSSWDEAPAQVTRRLVEGLFGRQLSPQGVGLMSNVDALAYGMLGDARHRRGIA
jgi:hypothetical protein